MKFNKFKSASRRKNRKAHFAAPSHIRRVIMSASLNAENRAKYGVRSLPIRREDEVLVVRGLHKHKEGKVQAVYRKRYIIRIERLSKEKSNGMTVPIGVHPSNVQITKLKLDKDRKNLIERKKAHKEGKDKGKISGADVASAQASKTEPSPMQTVD